MDLKSTLNLPNADFAIPMKADLTHLEPRIQAEWERIGIYHKLLETRSGDPTFVLHDGPPYTNGPIHLGTAMNKILKDFVVKSRTMMGFRCPYVPGYDNHGLPIEQAVVKKLAEEGNKHPSVIEIRKASREHATGFVTLQNQQFKRLGVFGLWEDPYTTMDFKFEAAIVRIFKRLAEGGYVYKGLRPTLWSPTCRTALADTEIVYMNHVSTALTVRFALRRDPNKLFQKFPKLFTVIWTTTPWTIPANLAVAFHPELTYAVVRVGDKHYLLLEDLLGANAEKCGWAQYEVVERLQGINLEHAVFTHPLWDRDSIAVMADYVTTEDGTGVVHTAPGHGREDFITGQAYNLPVLCPVDETGHMTDQAHEFAGLSYKECDKAVIDALRAKGALLATEEYAHSYPHAERDEKPVIFRATEQWFVGIDRNDLRTRMLEQIKGVTWRPESSITRIHSMVLNRPDWCISRQRPWGVGLPIFYGANSREPVLDPVAIEAVAQLVEREGSDAWFEKDPFEILPAGYSHPDTGETEFTKEVDVLDVWFDSGCTSLCVLEGDVRSEWKEPWPADMYLEGSDQHRGWFNSSLVIGVATRGQAPYKAVVTHGFVNDEKGVKMSKRFGNVVDPVKASETHGAEVLRYWVASVNYSNDVPCSENLLKNFGEHYRRVRNTLRFLMGNVWDFEPAAFKGAPMELDEWLIEQVDLLVSDCVRQYRDCDFGSVITSIHNFCVNELSAFYLDAIKDRMYCEAPDSPERRSAQWACSKALVALNRLIAPILPHTAEEVREKLNASNGLPSVHAERFELPSEKRLAEIEGSKLQVKYAALLEARAEAFSAFEKWKVENGLKDSQDAILTMTTRSDEILAFSIEELALYFKMSWVEVSPGEPSYDFRKSEYLKCERSRLRRPDVDMVDGTPLSKRDRRVLESIRGAV